MRSTFALLVLFLSLSASAQFPDIINVTPPAAIGNDLSGQWRITIHNPGGTAVSGARLSLNVNNAQFVEMSPQLDCVPPRSPTTAFNDCVLPTLASRGTFEVLVTLRTAFRYGTVFTAASVGLPETVPFVHTLTATFWKDFMVTSTADSGPRTLRQAILDINADQECRTLVFSQPVPCRAAFDIEQKIGGDFFHTVELLSPLPALDVPRSSVDGSTEDQSNTLGPSVVLDGAALFQGNGITVASGACDVKGIAIGSFPWNGIYAAGTARVNVDRSYIGINALGMVPKPNGSRGIASEMVAGTITNNVIAFNGRSGIFFTGPVNRGVEIANNRIFRNGASGIYVGGNERQYNFTIIRDNIISSNAHFGVAVNPGALVIVEPNSIHSNNGGGIDIGLDGPTGGIQGIPGRGGIYPPPVITSARYENGATIIAGTVQPSGLTGSTLVYLYANSELEPGGYAEGETYLAVVSAHDGTFTITLPRDLRGKYVNGVTRRNQAVPYDDTGETATSEFGRAMLVQ